MNFRQLAKGANFVICLILVMGLATALSFSDTNQSDFNLGTYDNTTYNGTSLVLVGNNVSGSFTSRVFDSGSYARWTSFNQTSVKNGKEYLFALDNNRNVFRSQNNGTSWTNVTVSDFVQDSDGFVINSSGAFFIVADDKKVYVSLNSGVTWAVLNSTVQFADLPRGLTIDSNNTMYSIVRGKRIYKSTNNGVNWNLINDTFASGATNIGRCIMYYNNSLYTFDDNSAFYKSTTQGVTWTMINASFAAPHCFSMAVNSSGAFIVAADNQRVYGSVNQGVTWTQLTPSIVFAADVNGISIDFHDTLYAAVRQGRFYRSNDGGFNWTLVNSSYSSVNTGNQYGTIYRPIRTNVTFQVRNCSSSNCADGDFIGPDGTASTFFSETNATFNLTGRYFQYKLVSTTQEAGFTPYAQNTSGQYVLVDIVPPQFSNILGPSSPTTYTSSAIYSFNITWVDASSISEVLLELNGVNYSLSSAQVIQNGDDYSLSLTGLGAGSYQYRWYANDTSGNTNVSDSGTLIITQAGNPISLFINSIQNNATVAYGSVVNVSAIATEGIVTLDRDGSGVSNPDISILGAKTEEYQYTATVAGNQNYTGNSSVLYVRVNKANASISLYINGSQSNLTTLYGTEVTTHGDESNGGDGDLIYGLYRDNVLVSSGSSASDIDVLGAGNYTYVFNVTDGENYTGSSVTLGLSVLQASPSLELLINGVDSDSSTTLNTNVSVNASVLVPSDRTAEIYENAILVSTSNSYFVNKSYSTNGPVSWQILFTGNQNYTSLTKSHTLSVLDVDAPQFSNVIASPVGPHYSNSNIYVFNSTWTDATGISDVLFVLNGTSYAYSSGAIIKNGDEYSINLSGLAAGNYTYTWFANDTSGNNAETPDQNYLVSRASTQLVISFSPSNETTYGMETNVSCSADNTESLGSLLLDGASVTNPDQRILAAGIHHYDCTSVDTQNYSSSASGGDIFVSKASPNLVLLLNGQSSDLVLSENGGIVTINASLLAPPAEVVNMTIDGVVIAQGLGSVESTNEFNVTGTYVVAASYGGNNNYSSGSNSFNIVVPSASSGNSSGQDGTRASMSVEEPSRVSLKPGESTRTEVKVINTGTKVLENCQITNIGDWLSSNDVQDIGRGDSARFDLSVSVPSAQSPGLYSSDFTVACTNIKESSQLRIDVYTAETPISQDKTKVTLIGAVQVSDGLFRVTYEAQELSGKTQTITVKFSLVDETGKRVEFFDTRTLTAKDKEQFVVDILANQQLTGKVTLNIENGPEQSTLVLQSQAPAADTISGLAILSQKRVSDIGAAVLLIVSALLIAYLIHRTHRLQDRVIVHKRLAGR